MSEFVLDDILLPEQVAEKLNVSLSKVLRLARRGEIPAKKVGRGEWRFKASEIDRWFADWELNRFDPNRKAGEIIEALHGKKKNRI